MSVASVDHSVDIVVCVHNSLDDVVACLQSVQRTMRSKDRLIIVDDGSATETQSFCEKISTEMGGSSCILIRRDEGSGFCKAANAGLRVTTAETTIILNSDTVVVGDWISRLVGCMVSNWQVGLVGPLSNAGGWQSIPQIPNENLISNPVPNDLDSIRSIHKYCAMFGEKFPPPIVEQLNGFCLAISREVLNVVGLFDEVNFPHGYGEENDFTFRAMNKGYLCAVALDCFVYHAKTKSYTPEARIELSKRGQANLHVLHGMVRVTSAVKQTQEHRTLKAVRAMAGRDFSESGWLK